MKLRLVAVQTRESYYIADLADLERLLCAGYEIVAAVVMGGDKIVYTLQRR